MENYDSFINIIFSSLVDKAAKYYKQVLRATLTVSFILKLI